MNAYYLSFAARLHTSQSPSSVVAGPTQVSSRVERDRSIHPTTGWEGREGGRARANSQARPGSAGQENIKSSQLGREDQLRTL